MSYRHFLLHDYELKNARSGNLLQFAYAIGLACDIGGSYSKSEQHASSSGTKMTTSKNELHASYEVNSCSSLL